MVYSERFMDSYPYDMSQMPYGRHPYHPCFGSGPQMKVEQPRDRYGYPSQCHHGCGADDYFAEPGARVANPYCAQQSAPFVHHGVYPRYDAACRGPHEPERYDYGPCNYGCLGSGCCNHSLGCGKNFKAGEMMPEVNEKIDDVKCYPHATMPFPNGYPMKMDEVPCMKRSPNQFDAGRSRPLYPMPLEEQEKFSWLHGYDPLTRRMNSNGRSKSPNASDINRTCDGKASRQPFAHPAERTNEAHPSKKVRTIEVKDVSKANQNNGTDSVQIGAVANKSGVVLDVKLKKAYSDEEAALLIQSVYRGYVVRRFDLLDKLQKIANICEQAAGVEGRIQSLLTSPRHVDEKQRLILEESIMFLLLKLDGVQGLPPQFRETRKSAARELTRMQERLDSLIMQKYEEVKHEEMSEPLEQCAETKSEELKDGKDNEGTKAECGNESCKDEQLIDLDKSETAIPDPATESLCAFMDKENHVENLREDEGTDSEKVAMDVELEVNPVVEFEVNLEGEHEVNPNVELEVNLNHEPVKGCEVEQPENDEQPELEVDDDAGLKSPESVTLDSGITDETQLKSGGSEMKTQIEGGILVGTLSSTTAASENEMHVEETGGNDPKIQIDGEGLVVTLPSPESMLPETEIPDRAQMEFDVVELDIRDGGEVLDDTFSCPAAVEQDEVAGVTIEDHEKVVKENEELRKFTEKLVEVTKEQSAVISDLYKRVDNMERRLSAKEKSMKNKRNKKR